MGEKIRLARTLDQVRQRIGQARSRGLGEQNTKATLIDPVLRALGWDTEDIEEVVREYKVKRQDKPVDYALLTVRTPRLFVEAKPLGDNLNDRKWANQIMGYAAVAGVEWIVLTNGNEYRIYNTHAPVNVDEKLFRSVRVTDGAGLVEETLELLSKSRLEENRIDLLWRAHFVDRQVRAALEDLFSGDNDMLLVNHVLGRTKNLTADEVRASLCRCKVHLDFPVAAEEIIRKMTPDPTRKSMRKAGGGTARKTPVAYDVALKDLIGHGLLRPPVALKTKYKGRELAARIEKDGSVVCLGTSYTSLSLAAAMARASIIGKRADGGLPPTNGWTFWKYTAPDGRAVEMDALRKAFTASRAATAS